MVVVLIVQPGYTAESTISPDGQRIVFTSDFEGDLELYTMDLDGKNMERMTYTPGCMFFLLRGLFLTV
jgi:TolB protein